MAKLVPGDLDCSQRLGMERTEWAEQNFRPRAGRSIVIETEKIAPAGGGEGLGLGVLTWALQWRSPQFKLMQSRRDLLLDRGAG